MLAPATEEDEFAEEDENDEDSDEVFGDESEDVYFNDNWSQKCMRFLSRHAKKRKGSVRYLSSID